MVALVSGNGLGLSLSSLATLGQNGSTGTSRTGQSGEQAFVNLANGNLVLQTLDDHFASAGADIDIVRTYNSQGLANEAWRVGVERQKITAAGSGALVRTDFDGAAARYTLNAGVYVTSEGAGADDTITMEGGQYRWTDGETGRVEWYDGASGALVRSQDRDGNETLYAYVSGRLASVTSASGDVVRYTYDLGRVASISTSLAGGGTSSQVRYEYDAAGRLKTVGDLSQNKLTTYQYDLAGNRVREKTVQEGVTYQDNFLAYDALGRLKWVADGRAHVEIQYDLAGNRTRIATHVITVDDARHDTARHYQYDTMNRQVVADANANGELGESGHRITYDKLGNKTSDMWSGRKVERIEAQRLVFQVQQNNGAYTDPDVYDTAVSYAASAGQTTEKYVYDAQGRIAAIERDGQVIDERRYDAAGRLVKSGKVGLETGFLAAMHGVNSAGAVLQGNGTEVRMSQYDAQGRLLAQGGFKSEGDAVITAGDLKYVTDYRRQVIEGNGQIRTELDIDAAGNQLGYHYVSHEAGKSWRYTTSYEAAEGYRQATQTGREVAGLYGNAANGEEGKTTFTYDANGNLKSLKDEKQSANDRQFRHDAAGKVLHVSQGSAATGGVHVQRQLIVNGEVLGRYGEAVDDAAGRDAQGKAKAFETVADFGFGFQSDAGDTPGAQAKSHVVGVGDTMQGLSQLYFGDSRLWYRIAEANGIGSNADLRAGQVLSIPGAQANGNAAGTYRPYNPAEIVGSTSPHVPLPKPKSVGFLKQLLVMVVAIVAVAYGAPMIAESLAAAFPTLSVAAGTTGSVAYTTAGVTTSLTSTGAVIAEAAAASLGSLASQAVGVGIGAQESISWKSVALSALSAGVAQGVSSAAVPGSLLADMGKVGRAAVGNAITQGVGVATGLQDRFSWRSVAASAVGAGVGRAVGTQLGDSLGGRLATGLIAGAATAVTRGGRTAVQQVAIDAFGSAIGSDFAENASGMSKPSSASYVNELDRASDAYRPEFNYAYRNEVDRASDAYNPANAHGYRNGSDVQSDAYNPAFAHGYRNAMDFASDNFNPAALGNYKNGMDNASDNAHTARQRRERLARGAAGETAREVNRSVSSAVPVAEVPFAGRSTINDPRAYETPQQRMARLSVMSNQAAELFTSPEWKSAAREYKLLEGKGFTPDSIYNGLITKGQQLDFAARRPGGDALDHMAAIAIDANMPADMGRAIGSHIGGTIDRAMSAVGRKPNVTLPGIGSAVVPAGQWTAVNESMSDRARTYQEQVTGRSGEAYVVGGVKFDGAVPGAYIDAKSAYAQFVDKKGKFADWWQGADSLVAQASRQVAVARGTEVQWHFAEQAAAQAAQRLLNQNAITGVRVIHTPAK